MCLDNPLQWLGNVPLVTFPAFSLLIIIFVFWTLTPNPFNSNAPFQASNITFKPSSISLTKAKSSEYSSSYGHSALISLDSSLSPMMNNEALNTDPCCKPSCTRKSTMKVPLTLILLQTLLYIDFTISTNHSSTPRFLKAHHTTFHIFLGSLEGGLDRVLFVAELEFPCGLTWVPEDT